MTDLLHDLIDVVNAMTALRRRLDDLPVPHNFAPLELDGLEDIRYAALRLAGTAEACIKEDEGE